MKALYCFLISHLFLCNIFSQAIDPPSPVNICQGDSQLLSVTGVPVTTTYQWQLNGTDIPGATLITYTVVSAGDYTVILNGGTTPGDTLGPVTVIVNSLPTAAFSFSPNNSCANRPINFINTSTGTGLSYSWNFDDPASGANNTSAVTNPVHNFIGTPGTGTQVFNVKLIVTSSAGCKDSLTLPVTAVQRPGTELGGSGAVIYNGLPYFSVCSPNTNSIFTFVNLTTTPSNTNYQIIWGDGQPDFNSPVFVTTTHTYNIGNYTLLYIVTGSNGCVDTARYYIFAGINPAVGLSNPGNTSICTQSSLTFPITNTQSNPPGTTYTITFNDGTPPVVFNHPPPSSITHVFTNSSCGTTSSDGSNTYTNSFSGIIVASNPCGTSSSSVVPIYVSRKPAASFITSPHDTACVNNPVTFTNNGSSGNTISAGNCINGNQVWSISPAAGWTLVAGALGNDFGLPDPSLWISGTNSIQINFTLPGVYTIKLKVGANTLCGIDSITRTICVNPTPLAVFLTDTITGCAPLTVNTTNNSPSPLCGQNRYLWAVTYASTAGCLPATNGATFINGTSATSTAPEFLLSNPGIYTISLVTIAPASACTSVVATQQITVKGKPVVNLNPLADICVNQSVTPVATATCYTTAATYAWSFPGGIPASASTLNPGPVTYPNAGIYTVSLSVTNECGTTTETRQINVDTVSISDAGPAQMLCGSTVTLAGNVPLIGSGTWTKISGPAATIVTPSSPITTVTGLTPGVYVFQWTITFGVCISTSQVTITIITGPTAANAGPAQSHCRADSITLTGNIPLIGTGTWTQTAGPLPATISNPGSPTTGVSGLVPGVYTFLWTISFANCTPSNGSVTITIYDTPTVSIAGPDQTICAATTTMAANAAAVGTGLWSLVSGPNTPGITTPSSPTTTITGLIAGTYVFQWTISNGICPSSNSTVQVVVTPQPTASVAGPDQTICATNNVTLAANIPVIGTGLWTQVSGPPCTITNINSPNTTVTGMTPGVYVFSWTISSGVCPPSSSSVTITINDNVTIADAGAAQTLCGTTVTMAGNTPLIGTGLWTQVAGPVANIVNPTLPATTITGLVTASYVFRWTITNGACSSFSDVAVTIITGPTVSNAGPAQSWCLADSVILTGNIPVFGTGTWSQMAGPLAVITSPNSSTTSVTGLVPGIYTFRWTISFANCTPSISNVTITIYDTPTVSFAGPDQIICATTTTMAANTPLVGTGLWTFVAGPATPGITTPASPATGITGLIPGTFIFRWTISNGVCPSSSSVVWITVTPPPTPSVAGPNQTLCADTTATLAGNTPAIGNGIWTQVAGPSSSVITAPNSPNSTVTGLVTGVYVYSWTISNGVCPSSSSNVTINVLDSLQNLVNPDTATICSGQTILLNGALPNGGTGSYSYQWQQSNDGVSWTNIAAATAQSYTAAPTITTYFRRQVSSLPCLTFSNIILITVQAPISNNLISADQGICINNPAAIVIGNIPTGGNGIYSYQWQQSTDGGTIWTDIPGAVLKDYDPGTPLVTTKYRRLVTTTLCTGPQSNISNLVTVTVNPDSRAIFSPVDTLGCAPFVLTPAIVNLQLFPANNAEYFWYVNGVLLGTGPVFPGTTIVNPDDSITLKLRTTSLFGCLEDSISHKFITRKRPAPTFTVSDTLGCGPLPVTITNTTAFINLFTYEWDFGNGTTSTLVQPGTVIFQPNPNSGDTVYTIRLKVTTVCDTIVSTQTVRVQSKPKALFTPDRSVGCSPFTVVFTNTSRGVGNSYFWDFGDGNTLNVPTNAPVSHTYYTGIQDTFYVKLRATNNCGEDSTVYTLVVSPNSINLLFGVNGNQLRGCVPHTVDFINNSSGGTSFYWDFGDGSPIVATTLNVDTVTHTYLSAGVFTAVLRATNSCSDTSTSLIITVFQKPVPAFTADKYYACIGDTFHFTNATDTATSYLWQFGDGNTSSQINPMHQYTAPGLYRVVLTAFRTYPSGTVCSDTISRLVNVVTSLPGSFDLTDSIGPCAPFTITFFNRNLPAVSTVWDFGDGNTGTGNTITHTYLLPGTYIVRLTSIAPGGCTYNSQKTVNIFGPQGTMLYNGGFYCNSEPVRFEATVSNTDTLIWDFGDGNTLVTAQRIVYHSYLFAGVYLPKVTLRSNAGCLFPVLGLDTIKIDYIEAGFRSTALQYCGYTTVQLTDTSHAYFGLQNISWDFGDGTTGSGGLVSHNYSTSGNYTITLIIHGNSNCFDTIIRSIPVVIKSKPAALIQADTTGCTFVPVIFNGVIQSIDSINLVSWYASNGVNGNGTPINISFSLPGTYTVRLITGTVYGCYDTAIHNIVINPTPVVSATNDLNLCLGNSVQLLATGGVSQYFWTPSQGLSCTNCANPIASPVTTTVYQVQGVNAFGCSNYDSLVISVIQPFRVTTSMNDTICIGQSTQITASGASNYSWSPATGLNTATIATPIATPTLTTTYRVVGKDNYNCFTDTGYVVVIVGPYPTVELGNNLTLSTGTLYSFNPIVQNGPIRDWLWIPATDLNCNTCPKPVATLKENITYRVRVTTEYGCSAEDTIRIKVFCEDSQVFVPNTFTPDGDGLNDIMMLRGTGILSVKSFRIFNRWGAIVFERNNFPPNTPAYGWDGKVSGKAVPPDVFVYTAEVICDNGTPYTFKGNITLIK